MIRFNKSGIDKWVSGDGRFTIVKVAPSYYLLNDTHNHNGTCYRNGIRDTLAECQQLASDWLDPYRYAWFLVQAGSDHELTTGWDGDKIIDCRPNAYNFPAYVNAGVKMFRSRVAAEFEASKVLSQTTTGPYLHLTVRNVIATVEQWRTIPE